MPTGPYHLCTPNLRKADFNTVSRALLSNDITFFHEQLHTCGYLFFCSVEMSYHPKAPLNFLNFELSSQPFPYATPMDSLNREQQAQIKSKKNEKKLCSLLKDQNFVSNWGEVLVYECAIHDLVIKRVLNIIRCKASKLFDPWISKLQNQKNVIPSALLVRTVKQLSNSLPGRFHVNEGAYLDCQVSLSRKTFFNYVQKENFFSFVTISPSSHLMLFDQKIVHSQCVYPISVRVYGIR